jgi:hypothetical protein
MVLVPLPWIKFLLRINCSLIDCARNSDIDQLAGSLQDKGTSHSSLLTKDQKKKWHGKRTEWSSRLTKVAHHPEQG